jgi:hypothetical protein
MPFVKGDPNINREGRPKGFSIVAHLKEKLQEIPEGQKETYATLITKKYLHKALVEGDTAILKDLIDRVDGKALQQMELEAKGNFEFVIKKPDETNRDTI